MLNLRGKLTLPIILIWYKCIGGIGEILVGVSLLFFNYVIRPETFQNLINRLANGELSEDPHDWLATWLLAQNSSWFYSLSLHLGLVLIVLGISKLIIAFALWKNHKVLLRLGLVIIVVSVILLAVELWWHFSWLKLILLIIETIVGLMVWRHHQSLMKR